MDFLKKFYSGLNKSTKITLISCGSFLLLTILILLFFVLFPIKPSERVISGLGRGGVISADKNDADNNDQNAALPITTTIPGDDNDEIVVTGTTPPPLEDYEFNVDVTYTTKGTFFSYIYSGNPIRTGTPGQNDYTTVTTINPQPSTEPPQDTTEAPPLTTDAPAAVTTAPAVTTQAVVITTAAIEVTQPPTEAVPDVPIPTQPVDVPDVKPTEAPPPPVAEEQPQPEE